VVKYFFQTLEKVTKKNLSKRWFNIMETRSEVAMAMSQKRFLMDLQTLLNSEMNDYTFTVYYIYYILLIVRVLKYNIILR